MSKKIDLERLKALTGNKKEEKAAATAKKTKAASKAAPSSRTRRRQVDDDDEVAAAEEGEDDDDDDGDDDDDDKEDRLFDSDEENEITEKSRQQRGSTALGKRKASAKKAPAVTTRGKKAKSRLDELDDDDDYVEDEGEEEEGEEGEAGEGDEERKSAWLDEGDKDEVDESGTATLADYHRITASRKVLTKAMNEPFFDQAFLGLFVRVKVGAIQVVVKDAYNRIVVDSEGQPETVRKDIFRMCEIVEVEEARQPYRLAKDVAVTTTKRLRLKWGSAEVSQKLMLLSNSKPTPREFADFIKESKGVRGFKELTKKQVQRRLDRYRNLTKGHKYTSEEITSMIKKNAAGGLQSGKINFSSLTFEEAMKKLGVEKEQAEAQGDDTLVATINKDMETLRTKKAKIDAAIVEQSRRQAAINRRMMQENMRKDMAVAKTMEKELKRGAAAKLIDPFVRRETRPRNLWIEGMKTKDQNAAAAAEKEKEKDKAAAEDALRAKQGAKAKQLAATVLQAGFDVNIAMSHDYMEPEKVHARVLERLRALIKADFPDPLEVKNVSRAERNLQRIYAKFPELMDLPKGSAEREAYRRTICPNSISFDEYLSTIANKSE